MKLRTILFVEDNPSDIDLTWEALKASKVANRVVLVEDGIEALDYLSCKGIHTIRKPGNPGLIVLDLNMPRMDGLEFLSIIKEDIKFKRIPVIMLTSSKEEEQLIKAYNLGVNAYIVKPSNFISLVRVVQKIAIYWATINELPSE